MIWDGVEEGIIRQNPGLMNVSMKTILFYTIQKAFDICI